jgi:hypothetical protein
VLTRLDRIGIDLGTELINHRLNEGIALQTLKGGVTFGASLGIMN